MSEVTDLNNLYEAFKASMKGSSWKEEPQRFERNFLSEIVKLKDEIESKRYKTSKGSEFTLNERGKTRIIHGGRMRDRVVRHSLADNVLTDAMAPYLIPTNCASQTGKGLSYARKTFERYLHNYYLEYGTNDGYVLFTDMSKFYDNVRHDISCNIPRGKISEDDQWLLENIVHSFAKDVSYLSDEEYEHCLDILFNSLDYYSTEYYKHPLKEKFMYKSADIGDQVSQNIGIYYPIRIDNYIKIVCGCKYDIRYCDDLAIIHSSKEFLENTVLPGIIDIAENELGLFINRKKTRICHLSDTYTFLQIKYSLSDTGRVIAKIKPIALKRERDRLRQFKDLYDSGVMSLEQIENNYKSFIGDHRKYMSRDQLLNMKDYYFQIFGEEAPRWK